MYQLGALMPARESRVVEYKAGGGNYAINILPTHINKYGSAFLNSSGGTLCIGVNDDGNAIVNPCRHTLYRVSFRIFVKWGGGGGKDYSNIIISSVFKP